MTQAEKLPKPFVLEMTPLKTEVYDEAN